MSEIYLIISGMKKIKFNNNQVRIQSVLFIDLSV